MQKITNEYDFKMAYDISDEIRKVHPAALAGFSFYPATNFSISAAYHHVLTNFFKPRFDGDNTEYRMGFVQVGAAYQF